MEAGEIGNECQKAGCIQRFANVTPGEQRQEMSSFCAPIISIY